MDFNVNFWISIFIFLATFLTIFSEKYNRAIIALFWAMCMVWVGHYMWFYSFEQVLESIDFNTILLLFWMMVIVTLLEKTWFFQYVAIKTAKKTGWNIWLLTVFLWALTSILSMILDNVTTIILIVPVTIIITKLLKINPVPILLAEAILSNIGWVATLVWDPPNIMIWSAAWFSFNSFLVHSLPVVVLSWIVVLFYLRFAFRRDFSSNTCKNSDALQKIDENKCIKDPYTLKVTLLVLLGIVILFFCHGYLQIPASFIALFGASLLLFLSFPKKDPYNIFKKVEWSVMVFFVSLFVLVWWLEHAWVLEMLANMMIEHAADNILLTAIIILWLSAILSAFVDNISMTVAMIPILSMLQTKWIDGVNILWWALVFWVWFWWNATPIWSTAWVIVTAKSGSHKHPITLKTWLVTGLPAAILSLLVATYALIVFYPFFMG